AGGTGSTSEGRYYTFRKLFGCGTEGGSLSLLSQFTRGLHTRPSHAVGQSTARMAVQGEGFPRFLSAATRPGGREGGPPARPCRFRSPGAADGPGRVARASGGRAAGGHSLDLEPEQGRC